VRTPRLFAVVLVRAEQCRHARACVCVSLGTVILYGCFIDSLHSCMGVQTTVMQIRGARLAERRTLHNPQEPKVELSGKLRLEVADSSPAHTNTAQFSG
jgi:hypothetical protein